MINNHLIIDAMAMQQVKARYDEAEKNNNTEGMEAKKILSGTFPADRKPGRGLCEGIPAL